MTHLMGADLNNIVKCQKLTDDHVQFLIYQILRGLKVKHFVMKCIGTEGLLYLACFINIGLTVNVLYIALLQTDYKLSFGARSTQLLNDNVNVVLTVFSLFWFSISTQQTSYTE